MQTNKLKMKICLIGGYRTGKTSLIRRYVYHEFDDKYTVTLGTKVTKKKMDLVLPEQDLKYDIDLVIWDIMGQVNFRHLLKQAYFHGAHGALAVADCTVEDSLQDLDMWLNSLYSVTDKIPVVIMANKVDMEDSIVIEENEVKKFVKNHNYPYYLTSAKTGLNVEECFKEIARKIIEDQLKVQVAPSQA